MSSTPPFPTVSGISGPYGDLSGFHYHPNVTPELGVTFHYYWQAPSCDRPSNCAAYFAKGASDAPISLALFEQSVRNDWQPKDQRRLSVMRKISISHESVAKREAVKLKEYFRKRP